MEKHTSTQSSIEDTQQRSSFVFYTCMRIELKVLLCNILHIAHHFAQFFSSLITLEESPSLDRDPSFSWGSHFSRFSAQNTKPQGDRPEKQPFSNAPLLLWAFVFSKNQHFFERSRCVFAICQWFSILDSVLTHSRCIFGARDFRAGPLFSVFLMLVHQPVAILPNVNFC